MKLAHLIPLVAGAVLATAADYSIDWFKVAGGGGTSTNGQYSLSGTIGQHDAGVMSNGVYTLTGGFWSLVTAIQTPGAPTLMVRQLPGKVQVYWNGPAPNWVLDQAGLVSAAGTPWALVPVSQYQTNASEISITLDPPIGNQYYRLRNTTP